jgi:SRSO17 transposase
VDYSTLGAPRDTDISSIPEEGAGAVDVDSSVRTQSASAEDRDGMPNTLSRQSAIKPPTSQKRSMDARWKLHDSAQKGNRNATKRSLAAQGQPVAEHTEQEIA